MGGRDIARGKDGGFRVGVYAESSARQRRRADVGLATVEEAEDHEQVKLRRERDRGGGGGGGGGGHLPGVLLPAGPELFEGDSDGRSAFRRPLAGVPGGRWLLLGAGGMAPCGSGCCTPLGLSHPPVHHQSRCHIPGMALSLCQKP